MQAYLIERTDEVGVEQYDAAVVVAADQIAALGMLPQVGMEWSAWGGSEDLMHRLTVTVIGPAAEEMEGCLLGSFNGLES